MHHPFNRNISSTSSFDSPLPSPPPIEIPLIPIELDLIKFKRDPALGPIDPRQYSAYNGLRSIENFVMEGEAGKGAYGTVQRAREKDSNGLPKGVRYSPLPILECTDSLTLLSHH